MENKLLNFKTSREIFLISLPLILNLALSSTIMLSTTMLLLIIVPDFILFICVKLSKINNVRYFAIHIPIRVVVAWIGIKYFSNELFNIINPGYGNFSAGAGLGILVYFFVSFISLITVIVFIYVNISFKNINYGLFNEFLIKYIQAKYLPFEIFFLCNFLLCNLLYIPLGPLATIVSYPLVIVQFYRHRKNFVKISEYSKFKVFYILTILPPTFVLIFFNVMIILTFYLIIVILKIFIITL